MYLQGTRKGKTSCAYLKDIDVDNKVKKLIYYEAWQKINFLRSMVKVLLTFEYRDL